MRHLIYSAYGFFSFDYKEKFSCFKICSEVFSSCLVSKYEILGIYVVIIITRKLALERYLMHIVGAKTEQQYSKNIKLLLEEELLARKHE
jgi:hypothetical protein